MKAVGPVALLTLALAGGANPGVATAGEVSTTTSAKPPRTTEQKPKFVQCMHDNLADLSRPRRGQDAPRIRGGK